MTLDRVPLRERQIIVAAHAEPALRRRLAELGIRSGAVIEPLLRTPSGGRVISVDGSRLALDKSMLQALEVRAA